MKQIKYKTFGGWEYEFKENELPYGYYRKNVWNLYSNVEISKQTNFNLFGKSSQ